MVSTKELAFREGSP